MAIVLVTGLPGHGKTLYSLVRWKEEAERDGRQVFHNGINGLKLDWIEHDPLKWHELPPLSIMVIDEAQKVFRIRPRGGEVPVHVSELETHRHGGIDLVLITQHPTLVDPHVRKLVERHFHVVRAFGTKNATIYEFPTGAQDYPEKTKRKPGVIEHKWRYPKAAFEWYTSAEVHTVKARIPMKVWLFLALLIAVPVLFGMVWWRFHAMSSGESHRATGSAASAPAAAQPVDMGDRFLTHSEAGLSVDRYLARFQPRIPGMPFTAPVYDAMTKPAEAPYPAVCVYGSDFPCRCWSQRGFALITPKDLCERLAREPMDPYWLHRREGGGYEIPGQDVEASSGSSRQAARASESPAPQAAQAAPVVAQDGPPPVATQ